jgi:hypothetical protein
MENEKITKFWLGGKKFDGKCQNYDALTRWQKIWWEIQKLQSFDQEVKNMMENANFTRLWPGGEIFYGKCKN